MPTPTQSTTPPRTARDNAGTIHTPIPEDQKREGQTKESACGCPDAERSDAVDRSRDDERNRDVNNKRTDVPSRTSTNEDAANPNRASDSSATQPQGGMPPR